MSNNCSFRKKNGGNLPNSAYIIDTDGSEAGLYRKMHIQTILIFMKKLFTPGAI
jgi:N-carbamoylputrescine amidase